MQKLNIADRSPLRLVIDDKIPFLRGRAERLGVCSYLDGRTISPDDVRDADVLIVRTRTRCDEALLADSRVQFVATATIGYDHLDTAFLERAGIAWANCPGCNAGSVAQYVESTLLLLVAQGVIGRNDVMGIVGVGHVGSRVATLAEHFGFRLLLCDPLREERGESGFVSLEQICEEADVVSFHTPLSLEGQHATFHMADDAFFSMLRRRPVLINTSRGEVVETRALNHALHIGQVRAAVIDVWENEPVPDVELLGRALIATPHIAGYSADGKANGSRMALEAVARYFNLGARFDDVLPPPLPADFAAAIEAMPDYASRQLALYDPRRDSRALKAAPGSFEQLRGHYPLRRERIV